MKAMSRLSNRGFSMRPVCGRHGLDFGFEEVLVWQSLIGLR
jgi:hypothetical protein